MASEVKYKKGGGNSSAVNSSYNRRKLNEWKQTFCELHKQKHEDCSCMIPYRLHTMPSNESMRLQWANTLNRKSLSKQVFACSEHFLDGKPTERNPIPVMLFLHLQDIKRNTFQKLSVSLMFLNRQVLAPEHNTNIHCFRKRWSHIRETMDWQPDYT